MASDLELKAKAVEEAVLSCWFAAQREPERADYWQSQADKLDRKFITEHGRHYAHFLPAYCPAK